MKRISVRTQVKLIHTVRNLTKKADGIRCFGSESVRDLATIKRRLEQVEASLTNGKWLTQKESEMIRRYP